jgi:hypothetical protein
MTDPLTRSDAFSRWLDYAVDDADDAAEGIGSGPHRPTPLPLPPKPSPDAYATDQKHRDAVKRWRYTCDRIRAGA